MDGQGTALKTYLEGMKVSVDECSESWSKTEESHVKTSFSLGQITVSKINLPLSCCEDKTDGEEIHVDSQNFQGGRVG